MDKDVEDAFKRLGMQIMKGFSETASKDDIKSIREDMAELRKDVREDMAELRKDVREDMAELRKDIREDMRAELRVIRQEMTSKEDRKPEIVGGE